MMYSRLKLARNLLREDGAIFISIDDNECANLRRLCDEVFGDANFVGQLVWQRSNKGDSKLIAKVHEYIVCYAKNKPAAIEAGPWQRRKEGVGEVLAYYDKLLEHSIRVTTRRFGKQCRLFIATFPATTPRQPTNITIGQMTEVSILLLDFAGPDDGRTSRPRHDIFHPITGKPCKKPSTGWRWDQAKTKWALEQSPPRIHFGPDETTIPNRKTYLKENTGETFASVFYRDGRSATLEVERLVGPGWFQFPKNTDRSRRVKSS